MIVEMNQSRKFRNTLKPIITTLSVLALCCSAISYGGYDKSEDSAIPSKPYFYTGSHTDGALEFDQYIIQSHYGFAVSLALKTGAPRVYRVLQDTKTYMFQQNQIALMQDVLAELKAVNKNLTDRLATPKPKEVAKWNVIDSNSDQTSQLPVGSIEENKQTALTKIVAYYTAQLAENGITELG